jgi:hypothetical protein
VEGRIPVSCSSWRAVLLPTIGQNSTSTGRAEARRYVSAAAFTDHHDRHDAYRIRDEDDVQPGKGKHHATKSSPVCRQGAVLTQIVLIAAAIATSASAVLPVRWPSSLTRGRARSNVPLLIVGVLALGSIVPFLWFTQAT